MSSPSPQVIEYLTRQLSRNPIHESGEIVRARAKAFKLEQQSSTPAKAAPPSGQRQKVRDELERIREQCFSGPVEPMLRSLVTMPLADYPDLAALARRLRVILDSRGKLPALTQNPNFDGDFFSVLKQVLVSPARDVAVLREQVLASFRQRRNRKRGQAMIRLLKSETPGLYTLEADWLNSLARYRGNSSLWGSSQNEGAVLTTQSSAGDGRGWVIWIFVMITIGAIRAAFNGFDRDESKPVTTPYRPPTVQQSPHSQRVDDSLKRMYELQQGQQNRRQQAQPTPQGNDRERPRSTNNGLDELMRQAKQEMEKARRAAQEAAERAEGATDPATMDHRADGLDRTGTSTPTPSFEGAPFATPRVVPMPSTPSTSPQR